MNDYSKLTNEVGAPVADNENAITAGPRGPVVMAERTNFKAYCIYSAAVSLVVYPISGHWIWGGGWLAQMGFHDFAGSTCVHMVGGATACLGAALLGPRIGKYDKAGKPHAIPGHNMTACALGVFILWFCWFGFNGGSTLAVSTDAAMESAGLVCFNTNLAAAVATCATMIFTWVRYGKPDVSMPPLLSIRRGMRAALTAKAAGHACPWAPALALPRCDFGLNLRLRRSRGF